VREAAVIGVPDEVRGQIPKAYVVAAGRTSALARDLQEFVKDRLSKHEYPRAIEIVDELPKTPAGKIDRKTLRERAS
jgi:acetyl-CoA synthetase